jgi:hypothetical protein
MTPFNPLPTTYCGPSNPNTSAKALDEQAPAAAKRTQQQREIVMAQSSFLWVAVWSKDPMPTHGEKQGTTVPISQTYQKNNQKQPPYSESRQ